MKKRILIVLVCLVAIVAFIAGYQQAFAEQVEITQEMLSSKVEEPVGPKGEFSGITIGFSQRNIAGSEWYENLIRVSNLEADHLGVKLIVIDAKYDLAKQAADIEDLLVQEVDSIILNPIDSSGVLPAVKKIHDSGTPLIIVNSVLDPAGAPFTFVSTYAFDTGWKSGFELGKAFDKKFGYKDEVKAVVLSANPQELESDQRRWGQIAGYNDYMLQKYAKTNLNIVAYAYYKWVPDEALLKAQDILQAHPDVDVIFVACDGGTQGVVPALKSAGLLGKVLVTSIDARKSVLQWIKDGDKGIVASVSNDPRLMGKWAVFFAAYAAKGYVTPATFYVPNPAITIENVDQYLDPMSKY